MFSQMSVRGGWVSLVPWGYVDISGTRFLLEWVCPEGSGYDQVGGYPPDMGHGIPRDMVGKRAARILLE